VSYTPGPWDIKYEWNVFAGERLVATTGGYTSSRNGEAVRQENIANARLIAAAPDLLGALTRIEMLDRRVYSGDEVEGWNWDEAIFAARDAILKATEGES
jgi:hypothetical protein